LIRKRIAGFERAYGYNRNYMREMLDLRLKGFMHCAKVMEPLQHFCPA
jgi:hypothetical protein